MPLITLDNTRLQVDSNSTEETLLWNYLASIVNITGITPVQYEGVIAGSEFLTYAATKMYFALTINFVYSAGTALASGGRTDFYNLNNVVDFYFVSDRPVYDASMKYSTINKEKKNIIFSRFVVTRFDYMLFVGYRITR